MSDRACALLAYTHISSHLNAEIVYGWATWWAESVRQSIRSVLRLLLGPDCSAFDESCAR